MNWTTLRAAFPALSPAQLHRLLTQYQLASAMGPLSAWEPGAQDSPEAFQPGEEQGDASICRLGAGPAPASLGLPEGSEGPPSCTFLPGSPCLPQGLVTLEEDRAGSLCTPKFPMQALMSVGQS